MCRQRRGWRRRSHRRDSMATPCMAKPRRGGAYGRLSANQAQGESMAGVFHSTDEAAMKKMAARFEHAELTVEMVDIGGIRVGHARADASIDDYVAVDERGCGAISSSRLGYQGLVGREALEKIYMDHVAGELDRRKIVNEGVTILASDHAGYEVFTGISGVPVVYWSEHGTTLTWSSVLYFMASTLPDLSLDPAALMELALNSSLVGGDTIFNDVNVLTDGASATMRHTERGHSWSTSPVPPLSPRTNVTAEEAAKTIVRIATDRYRILDLICDGFTVYMTGGLDSRLQLALILAAGVDRERIHLVYGVGNSFLTNTRQRDLEIVRQIASGEELHLTELDWTDDGFDDTGWEYAFGLGGEEAFAYGGNLKIIEQFLTTAETGQFVVFGYFGELLRPLDWQAAATDGVLTLSEFVDKNMRFRPEGVDPAVYTEMRSRMMAQYKQVLNLACDELLTEQDVLRANIEYRRSADTKYPRLCSLRGASLPVLGHPVVLETLLGLPFQAKSHSRLLVDVIRRCEPGLLSYDIFSHQRSHQLSSDGALERPSKDQAKSIVRGLLQALLPVGTRRWKLARTLYGKVRPDARSEELLEAAAVSLERAGLTILDPRAFSGDPRRLVFLAQHLRLYELAVMGKCPPSRPTP